MDRRNFLLYTVAVLGSATAYSFGESLKPLMNDKAPGVALIYGTRYGATKDTAHWIAKGMGDQVDVIDIENLDFDKDVARYDQLIIGSGIWIDGAHKQLMKLFAMHKEEIQSKIIASFIVCGTTSEDEAGQKRIESYFEKFYRPLDIKPPVQKYFGGRMIIEKLTKKDRKLLDNFYNKILKKEFVSWDRTNPKQAEDFGVLLAHQIQNIQEKT